ncbi:MAG: hypothetical protein N2D54_08995, partial [Chloroflexota bacterium]
GMGLGADYKNAVVTGKCVGFDHQLLYSQLKTIQKKKKNKIYIIVINYYGRDSICHTGGNGQGRKCSLFGPVSSLNSRLGEDNHLDKQKYF